MRTSFSLIANNLYQEERDLFVIRKRMPRIVIRPTVEISNRVESLSPRATSGTLYYPDVVPLPTRARNTFSRGYSRAYLITGFNCFRESVLSFRRFLDVPPFPFSKGNPRVSIRANIPNMRLKKRARSIIRVSNVTREREKERRNASAGVFSFNLYP